MVEQKSFSFSISKFEGSKTELAALRKILVQLDMKTTKDGGFETLLLMFRQLINWCDDKIVPDGEEYVFEHLYDMSQLSNILTLVSKIPLETLKLLKPHIAGLNKGTSLKSKELSYLDVPLFNQLFKLMIGLGFAQSRRIELIHPSRDFKEDVDIFFDHKNQEWGVVCNAISSSSPDFLLHEIQKGIERIEHSRADTGFIILSFKNCFPQDHIFRWENGKALGYRDLDMSVQELMKYSEKALQEMFWSMKPWNMEKLFEGKKALPVVLVTSQTMMGLSTLNSKKKRRSIITRHSALNSFPLIRDYSANLDAEEVFLELNLALNNMPRPVTMFNIGRFGGSK